MKLRERFKSTTKFERTRYTVTNKGIYIQTGIEYNEETLYIPLDKVNKVSAYGSTSSPDDSLGSVYISYSKSTDPAYSESGKDVDTMVCNITNIPDSGQVMELIEKSSEQRKAELDERKRLTGGISEAEKYREPTPLTAWRKKDDDIHTDPLIELRTMLTLAKEQKLPRAELEESVSNSARSLQTNTAAKPEKKKPVRKKSAGLVGDPQAAFFGDVRSLHQRAGTRDQHLVEPDDASYERYRLEIRYSLVLLYLFDMDRAVALSDCHAGALGAYHHDAFDQGLTAYRGLLDLSLDGTCFLGGRYVFGLGEVLHLLCIRDRSEVNFLYRHLLGIEIVYIVEYFLLSHVCSL